MSRYIATRAMRGANALVTEAEMMLDKHLRRGAGKSHRKVRRHRVRANCAANAVRAEVLLAHAR